MRRSALGEAEQELSELLRPGLAVLAGVPATAITPRVLVNRPTMNQATVSRFFICATPAHKNALASTE